MMEAKYYIVIDPDHFLIHKSFVSKWELEMLFDGFKYVRPDEYKRGSLTDYESWINKLLKERRISPILCPRIRRKATLPLSVLVTQYAKENDVGEYSLESALSLAHDAENSNVTDDILYLLAVSLTGGQGDAASWACMNWFAKRLVYRF